MNSLSLRFMQSGKDKQAIRPAHGRMLGSIAGFASATKRVIRQFLDRGVVSEELKRNYHVLSAEQETTLKQELQKHYFRDPCYYPEPEAYLSSAVGERDLADHLVNRLNSFRSTVVPWINSVLPLPRSRILEVGCGTGASTLAMAEEGACVLGIDENERALRVADMRCKLCGVDANFARANAARLDDVAKHGEFDAVIFFAVLEHMTWAERCMSLQAAWRILSSGQHLIVIETPNRLWHTDHHTTDAPFFHWLPDQIAFAYSRFTKRETYNEIFRDMTDEALVRFARWGRGVSYHDFVLSFNIPEDNLPVESYMQSFLKSRRRFASLLPTTERERDEKRLQRIAPNVHPGFLCADLYLSLRKP